MLCYVMLCYVISMDVMIRHKLIEIEDRVSDRFVILITNYRWLRILEVIRYRRSDRPILKNTRQIYKIFPLFMKGILIKCLW